MLKLKELIDGGPDGNTEYRIRTDIGVHIYFSVLTRNEKPRPLSNSEINSISNSGY